MPEDTAFVREVSVLHPTERKNRMKTKIFALCLCILMMLSLLPLSVLAEDTPEETVRVNMDFNQCAVTKEYGEVPGSSIPGTVYVGGNEMLLTRENAPKGIAARIHYMDMRWWSLALSEDNYRASMTVVPFEADNLDFQFTITTQDASTSNEGLGGRIISLEKNAEGKPVLLDRDLNAVYTMEWGQPYAIEVVLHRGSEKYAIIVNGETVSAESVYCSPVYGVFALRTHVGSGSDIILDEFSLSTWGKVYPQKYSVQPVGDMPEIEYPAPYEATGEYRVYHNTVRQTLAQDDIFVDDTNAYLTAEKAISILDPEVRYDGAAHTITAGETVVDITDKIVTQNDREMLSLASLNEIFGAKVWLDREECMIILSTGSYINDNFLRACDYKFVMNGQPYYELSFNKFDLSVNLLSYFFGGEVDASILENEEKSLKTLQENGFSAVRVFLNNPWTPNYASLRTEEGKETYYKAIDYMLELCDKYGIRLIASLQLETEVFLDAVEIDGTWVKSGEISAEIISDPDSKSRQFVYSYLDEFITRYKDRDTILMWEISNEINLDADVGPAVSVVMASAIQSGNFYKDITEYINALDQNHLVDSGDACMRGCSYSLLTDTMAGRSITWKPDTLEEHNRILWIFNHGINVISSHGGTTADEYANLMNCSRAWNKPLYLGETGDLPEGEGLTVMSPESLPAQKNHIEILIDSGVQLMTWWDFDAPLSNEEYKNLWNVTLETTPDLFYAIAEGNRTLKERYLVNGVALDAEKTPETSLLAEKYTVPETSAPETGDAVTDTGTEASGTEPAEGEGVHVGAIVVAIVAAVVVCGLGAVLALTNKKKKG